MADLTAWAARCMRCAMAAPAVLPMDEIAKRYRAGEACGNLAKEFGVNFKTLKKRLIKLGLAKIPGNQAPTTRKSGRKGVTPCFSAREFSQTFDTSPPFQSPQASCNTSQLTETKQSAIEKLESLVAAAPESFRDAVTESLQRKLLEALQADLEIKSIRDLATVHALWSKSAGLDKQAIGSVNVNIVQPLRTVSRRPGAGGCTVEAVEAVEVVEAVAQPDDELMDADSI